MDRLPEDLSRELERVVRRWRELPADHALAASADVRALINALANHPKLGVSLRGTESGSGVSLRGTKSEVVVPDLGSAVLIDQLRVLVWDAAAAGVPGLLDELTALRRRLP